MFQNGRPFHFSTENWYNFSCRLKTSDIYPPQDIYQHDFQPVKVVNIHKSSEHGAKSSYVYTVQSSERVNEIKIQLLNKSIIPTFLCDKRSGKFLIPASDPDSKFIRLENIRWPNKWNIFFEGSVSKLPTYVNVKIIELSTQHILFHRDQLIHKTYIDTAHHLLPYQNRFLFTNNFSFERNNITTAKLRGFGVRVEIKDCFQSHSFTLYRFSRAAFRNSWFNQTIAVHNITKMNFLYVADKITVLALSLGSVYIMLIFSYFLIQIHRYFRVTVDVEINDIRQLKKPQRPNPDMTYQRKCLMFFYVTFRVFYTFLLTLSVGFSLFLGIDTHSGELYTTNNRYYSWVRQESKQINQFSINELTRHLQYSSNLKKACENQDEYKIKRLDTEMLAALNSSLSRWYSYNSKSIINETIDFFNKTIDRYDTRLRQVSEKMEFNIRNRFYDRYGQYQQLVKQFYYLGYFTVIQTVFNSSNPYFSELNLKRNNRTFVQAYLVDFLNFISIYEPMSLNFDASQNLNKLKFNFNVFLKHKKKWSEKCKMQNAKIVKYPRSKVVYRMFDSKYLRYNKDHLVLRDVYQFNIDKKSFKIAVSFKIIQTRMFLVILDCFIVIYRFYNTFVILKWMWLGKKVMMYQGISRNVKCQTYTEIKHSDIDNNSRVNPIHRLSSTNDISLKMISNNQYPDWLPINQYQPSFNYCFKARKYLRSFERIHFVTVLIIFAVVMMLLAMVVVVNYLYIKHYNPDALKQNMVILEKMQPLINRRLKHIAGYVNDHILANAKIHNINISSLIINSSYILTHIQKNVCQQLTWEMNSIRERSNTHSVLPFDICRLQSDVNFLPYLLVHISPCHFLNVLPINYTLSAIFFDKTLQRSNSIRKLHYIIFLLICIIIAITTAIGSIHLFCNIFLKTVLKSSSNYRYVILTPFYPHNASFQIHSSSSHSTQSGRNLPIIESNCFIKHPLPTVTGAHFNDYSTSLLHFQLTATSESDV